MSDEQRRTKEERDMERLRGMGVDTGRTPDEDLPGRSIGKRTNEERVIERIRKAVAYMALASR